MKNALTKNLGWKLLSLALALALWIAVAREPELATSLSVPIEFKNIPDDLDISSDVPDRVHIEIRGPSGRLTRDYLADLAVVLDLGNVAVGERTFTVNSWNTHLPVGVTFYRAVPSQITLRFDRLTFKEVPVIPRYSKGPPAGYSIASFDLTPAKVRVRGPEDHIRRLDQINTDPIDLSGIVGKADFHVQVNIGDPQVRLESPPLVTYKVRLEKAAPKENKPPADKPNAP